jgi:hypothetical protein
MSLQRTKVAVGILYGWRRSTDARVRALKRKNQRELHAYAALALMALLALGGCASNGERIDAIARASSLERSVIEVEGFQSVTYFKRDAPASRTVLVFLEGDGRPWSGGVTPNVDPTTGNPLALELLIQTPRQGVYVARPC